MKKSLLIVVLVVASTVILLTQRQPEVERQNKADTAIAETHEPIRPTETPQGGSNFAVETSLPQSMHVDDSPTDITSANKKEIYKELFPNLETRPYVFNRMTEKGAALREGYRSVGAPFLPDLRMRRLNALRGGEYVALSESSNLELLRKEYREGTATEVLFQSGVRIARMPPNRSDNDTPVCVVRFSDRSLSRLYGSGRLFFLDHTESVTVGSRRGFTLLVKQNESPDAHQFWIKEFECTVADADQRFQDLQFAHLLATIDTHGEYLIPD